MNLEDPSNKDFETLNKLKKVDKVLAFFVHFSIFIVFISLGTTFYLLNFRGLSFIETYSQRIPLIGLSLGSLNLFSLALLFISTYISSASFFKSECIYARMCSTQPRYHKYKKLQSLRVQMGVSLIAFNSLAVFNLFSKSFWGSIVIGLLCIIMLISSINGFRKALKM